MIKISYINDIGPDDSYVPPGIKKITKDDLQTINSAHYYKKSQRRLVNSSPDMQQTAKLTFMYANPLHEKYPDKVDVLNVDTKKAQKVSKLPNVGYKGQVVEYHGKLFVAGDEVNGIKGKFKSSQRTIADYAKGKARTK